VVVGPLAEYADGLRGVLALAGYRPGSVERQVGVLAHLSRWLRFEGLAAGELTAGRVEEFADARRAAGYQRGLTVRSLATVVDFLRAEAVVPPPAVAEVTPVDVVVEAYRCWLVSERGSAPRTVGRYVGTARRFLAERSGSGGGGGGVEGLSAEEVHAFLLRECARLSVGAAKGRVSELRSLLRFLYLERHTEVLLASAVPGVAGWHGATLPRTLEAGQVAGLLASCDRSRPTGRRDFAILIVLARLGLRAAEVAGLELDDIDWRAGEIVVRSKGRRQDVLPLPADVGEALAAYVADDRPRVVCRSVFIRGRAGVPVVSAHWLRHTLATELLRRGAPLVEISQLLRHRDPAATVMYAKVDRGALRLVARPWPAGAP